MDVSGVFQPITTDWTQCDHRCLWRFGHDRKGNQAYRCPKCGRYFFEGVESRSLKRVRVIKALMQPGATIRSISEQEGVSNTLIVRYRKILRSKLPPCPCGRPAPHAGTCSSRQKKDQKELASLPEQSDSCG